MSLTLFTAHEPLALRLAAQYVRRRRVPAHDHDWYENTALAALFKAARKYDARRLPFVVYATSVIWNAMEDQARSDDTRSRNARRRGERNPCQHRSDRFWRAVLAPDAAEVDETLWTAGTTNQNAVVTMMYRAGLSQKEVAARLKVTPGRVCQIHGEALAAIRDSITEPLLGNTMKQASTGRARHR